MNVRPGLCKSNPTNPTEWLKQPVFANPLITNSDHRSLGGNAFTNTGCSRIKDFWDQESQEWKSLPTIGASFHTFNRQNRELIINSIPRIPTASDYMAIDGDWVSKREAPRNASPNWVYQVVETSANAREYRRTSPASRIQPSSSQNVTIPLAGYEPIRVLA
jgi:hypothetical protein